MNVHVLFVSRFDFHSETEGLTTYCRTDYDNGKSGFVGVKGELQAQTKNNYS